MSDIVEKQRKMDLFVTDLNRAKILHFPTLRDFIKNSSAKITGGMTDFLEKLRSNFAARFDDFKIPPGVMQRTVDAGGAFASKAKEVLNSLDDGLLQLELIDIQTSSDSKSRFLSGGCVQFWAELNQDHFQTPEVWPFSFWLCLVQLTHVSQAFHM